MCAYSYIKCMYAYYIILLYMRAWAYPPKLNGCDKLQIVILSGKKFENSSTHDFAQHISA